MEIVPKIDEGMNRREVLCTTYQMRNCFKQFADGVASELDVHCYAQHAYAADLLPKGGAVLDVCCGRGLLIPFLRYRGNPPVFYLGVDIHPRNAVFREGKDPRRPDQEKDWGFPTLFVESNVAEMTGPVLKGSTDRLFDLIVFTSAIEHMQPEAQRESLIRCRELAKPGATLYLPCPIPQPDQDGYACQYAAHVYEPKESELREWLTVAGWRVRKRIGLSTKATHFREVLKGSQIVGAEHLYSVLPREFALPVIAAFYPQSALEVAYVCSTEITE